MSQTDPISNLLEGFEARARRRGVDAGRAWCFGCGVAESEAVALNVCHCEFRGPFGCAGRYLCQDCRGAHAKIAQFLAKMFEMPVALRANGRRIRAFCRLRRAIERCGPEGRRLHRALGTGACPSEETEEFRAHTLAAFEASGFLDYQKLAQELAREEELAALVSSLRF